MAAASRNYREMETAGINATTRFLHAEWGGDSHAGRHMEVNKETGGKGIDNFNIEAADRNGDWARVISSASSTGT